MERAEAELRRDVGVARAELGAERAHSGWVRNALVFVRRFAAVNKWFMAEEVRAWAHANGYPLPPSAKSWGGVMRAAERAGIVAADGYAPANSSNRSPKVRWKSLVFRED